MVRVRRPVAILAMAGWFGSLAVIQAAPSVKSHVAWVSGEPNLVVRVEPGPLPEGITNAVVQLDAALINHRGLSVEGIGGQYGVKLTPDGKPVSSSFPLLKDKVPKERLWVSYQRVGDRDVEVPGDYIRVSVRNELAGLSSDELLYTLKSESLLHSYGIRLTGTGAVAKAMFAMHFGQLKAGQDQTAALEFYILDVEGNQLAKGQQQLILSDDRDTDIEVDVTPSRDATGPFTLMFTVSNEAIGLSVANEARFPFANFRVPVSGMEGDAFADWHIPSRLSAPGSCPEHLRPKDPLNPLVLPGTLFGFYQPFTRPVYDAEVRHSGTRSLRIDYTAGAPVVIGSNVRLPGLPVRARIWVKGNNTRDRLVLEYRDPCNLNAPAHQRFMNTLAVDVCVLDFSDWKCFTVPVLGNGLLARDSKAYNAGHSGQEVRHPVQIPINVAAIRVIPAPLAKDAKPEDAKVSRSVWIDDLQVETQAPRQSTNSVPQRMTVELRTDTAEARLHAGAQLFVSVGNGTLADIRAGRVEVEFLNGDGEAVAGADLSEPIDVPAGEIAVKSLALGPLEAGKPRGPVMAKVTVIGTTPGQQCKGRIVLSRPTGAAVFWDFERAERFLPRAPGEGDGVVPVAGGAGGTASALPLVMAADRPVSVMLHPAMPGIVEGVEIEVYGEGTPVLLQPVFADSGSKSFDLVYSQFAPAPVRVDWKGWKTCTFKAPPIPPDYVEAEKNPMYSPWYPLNLVLTARSEDGSPASIRVDQIKVSTHLATNRQVMVELDYADETMMHVAGAPLRVAIANFSTDPQAFEMRYRLTTPVGGTADQGVRKVSLAPGDRQYVTLVEKLSQGFYRLSLSGLPGGRGFDADVLVPDRKRYFGEALMERLADLPRLNADLGLTQKRINLDWDTTEPVPNINHHNWLRVHAAAASESNAYQVVPLVGYAADWAGPEKQEAVAAGKYTRDTGYYRQAPVRMADWEAFIRTIGREHGKDFQEWVFWQGPDVKDDPVYLPPAKYRSMLEIFQKWISLYNTNACVVAGGFTFDRVLNYLDEMQSPATLPYNRFEVRINPLGASVEDLRMEDFLEDLVAVLNPGASGKTVSVRELDWKTGGRLAPLDQAAYHARAAVILHAFGVLPHRFDSVNTEMSQDGFGMLFRPPYGNSFVRPSREFYVPKPAYYSVIETRKLLADLRFLERVAIADRDPLANRAFLFQRKGGGVCAVLWRVRGSRVYRLPAGWSTAVAVDALATPVRLEKELTLGAMPLFLDFADLPVDRIAHELRNLAPKDSDTQNSLVLDFYPAEAFGRQAAEYAVTGGDKAERRAGQLYTGERVAEPFLKDVSEERFAFRLGEPGDVLLSWLWCLDQPNQTNRAIRVTVNGTEQTLDLSPTKELLGTNSYEQVYLAGPRRSAVVLRGCRSGRNEVSLKHPAPAVSGGFRLTLVQTGRVDLTRCGPLLSRGDAPVQVLRNAWSGPLVLGAQTYDTGFGCLGRTVMEFPLNQQYARFEVTVGIDAATRGRGTVGFRILVDGKEKKSSGSMTGMTAPKTLSVDGLEGANRLMLMVENGGDGSENDLANWVDPVLYLKEKSK